MYKIKILPQADKDIRSFQKAGNKAALIKIHYFSVLYGWDFLLRSDEQHLNLEDYTPCMSNGSVSTGLFNGRRHAA